MSGNHLVDGMGQPITLHGVNIDGTEWSCLYGHAFADPSDEASVRAMVEWHINAVRIPLNEDCWLGINGAPTAIVNYHQAIGEYVSDLNSHGIYAILDLHWSAPGSTLSHLGPGFAGSYEMADADHSPAFWSSVAAYFRDNHAVLFDLFNEPHEISWSCWRRGCLAPRGYAAAGMQELVNAVRSTGATQPVMVGGNNWETELGAAWLSNRPTDPAGQLVAAAHLYGYAKPAQYNSDLGPVAAKVPVVIGETGETNCSDNEIEGLLNWADSHGVSYLAWEWSTGECGSKLSLITAFNGTPTPYGRGYREHLLQHFPPTVP